MSPRAIAVQAVLVAVNLVAMSVLASPMTARLFGICLAGLAVLVLLLSRVRVKGGVFLAVCVVAVVALCPWLAATELHQRAVAAPANPAVTSQHQAPRAAPRSTSWVANDGWVWSPRWRYGIAGGDREAVLVILIGSTTAFAAIFLSSLVDAAYVAPLMAGRWRSPKAPGMPCQSSLDGRWKSLTAMWLMHRLLATLGFVLGLTVVVTITVKRWVVPNDNQTAAAGIAAAATLLAGFYLTRARSVIAFAPNPALAVGDAVELVDEGTNHVRRYYVQDVSLEGIKLLELSDDDTSPNAGPVFWPPHDRMLDLPDVLKVLRSRRRFTPCGHTLSTCNRVNPYCPFKDDAPLTPSPPSTTPTGVRGWLAAALVLLGAVVGYDRPGQGGSH